MSTKSTLSCVCVCVYIYIYIYIAGKYVFDCETYISAKHPFQMFMGDNRVKTKMLCTGERSDI